MKPKFILFFVFILIANHTLSQRVGQTTENTPSLNKNILSFSAGWSALYTQESFDIFLSLKLHYERMIWNGEKFFKTGWVRISPGYWISLGGHEGPLLAEGLTLLSGSKNSHLEVNLDFVIYFDSYIYINNDSNFRTHTISPSISIGYRFYNPNHPLYSFRIGLGYPQIFYSGRSFWF